MPAFFPDPAFFQTDLEFISLAYHLRSSVSMGARRKTNPDDTVSGVNPELPQAIRGMFRMFFIRWQVHSDAL